MVPKFPDFLGKAVVRGPPSEPWEFGKGALSANDIFSTTSPWGPERVQTQFWAEDGLIAGIVEKIWL